jgi:hypothetical protein
MGRYDFDTSALVKNDHAEAGTAEVQRMLGEAGSESFISRLATVEGLSGFAGKARTGVFSRGHYARLRRRSLADVRRRMVRPIRVVNAHHRMAGDLIGKHAMSRPLRTLDAIQRAVALYFHRSFPIDPLVSLTGVRLMVPRHRRGGLPVLRSVSVCRHAASWTPVDSLGPIARGPGSSSRSPGRQRRRPSPGHRWVGVHDEPFGASSDVHFRYGLPARGAA